MRIWDFWRREEERVLRGHGADVRCVDWHAASSLIASGSRDPQQPLKLWDPRSGKPLATMFATPFLSSLTPSLPHSLTRFPSFPAFPACCLLLLLCSSAVLQYCTSLLVSLSFSLCIALLNSRVGRVSFRLVCFAFRFSFCFQNLVALH